MSESDDNNPVEGSASTPDFSHEALAHLQVQSDVFDLHVKTFLDTGNDANRGRLQEDLQRFRNTLVLLEKGAAVYVAEELIQLLEVDAAGNLSNQNELARVLVQAADQLSGHVALLQQDGNLESALSLLPLVNDSRACREESLLSEIVVLAAGIDVPQAKTASVTDERWQNDRDAWVACTSAQHAKFAQKLLRWWRAEDSKSAQALSALLLEFEQFCLRHDFLDVLVPLFQSAALVAEAVASRELRDGPALRSLYAQLERTIHRSALIASPEDLLPADLLRNYLYYVAQIESSSRVAIELRRRFRLDRIRQASLTISSSGTPTIGVGYHLANAIRHSVSAETQALRLWLDQLPTGADPPKVVRLRVRLKQLEPVLTLMGALEALACVQLINTDLENLDDEQIPENEIRLSLAESLVKLDILLDKNARQSVMRSAIQADRSAISGDDVFVDMATDACLREARIRLQQIGQTLEELLSAGPLKAGRCHQLSGQISVVEHALQVLPLPEVSPLLRGLIDVLSQLQISGLGQNNLIQRYAIDQGAQHVSVQQDVATLLLSVDYYLSCVLQTQPAASQLLQEAVDALEHARHSLSESEVSEAVPARAADEERQIIALLSHMDDIGASLTAYRADRGTQSVQKLRASLKAFDEQATVGSAAPLSRLAAAANTWFAKSGADSEQGLDHDELALLDEVHAVIPQLIDQLLGGADDVRGFNELLYLLEQTGLALDTSDTGALTLQDTGSLTLNVDDTLLSDPFDPSHSHALDNTLQHVFYHECLSHLEVLDESVRSALQPNADLTQRLPTEQMLRALHTLTGSAQTVEAPAIVAIVQPLQRAALAKQRLGDSFDAGQTRYIGDLVMALRARLDSLASGDSVAQSVKAVEQRLGSFLASCIPGSDAVDSGFGVATNVRSLDNVFAEEASELLDGLRALIQTPDFAQTDSNNALALLHTLKGSGRMAGRIAIADQAHALEAEVQELEDIEAQQLALSAGLAGFQALLMQGVVENTNAATESNMSAPVSSVQAFDSVMVSDSAFDALLDLATDVTVNHARLSDELARLREVYQDIESTVLRWSDIPFATDVSSRPAVREMLADLKAARTVMRAALGQAERKQQQASRASSGLQQSLIRTRLVRMDELRERLVLIIDDAAYATGCQAQLELEGGEVTLDRALFRQLTSSLEHLARNAIVHGIESGVERVAKGKSATGKLTLSASVDGTDLVVRFSDDGRGIERDAVSAVLQSRGESAVESHEALRCVLFKSGFSSIEKPTALAGHGLGLSAVQAAVEHIGGRVQFSTVPGKGTQINLRLPQRIVVNQVVLVDSGGVVFAIPVNYVDAVHIADDASERSTSLPADRHRHLPLSQLLAQRSFARRLPARRSVSGASKLPSALPTVLVTAAGESLALEVDQVIGYRELITQALGPQLAALQRFSGGSVLSDGRQVLILDLQRIVESLNTDEPAISTPARESVRPVALIVDDSLTMRAAAESVLQQCGIATRSSRDGVEALDSMAIALPNLIILDIEMPRLDGKDFLKRIKDQYDDACPPIIVVSSKDDALNRARMMALGATRFLAKPYTVSQLQEAVEAAGLQLPDLTIA